MRRVLITGENSFIGNSLYDWLNQSKELYDTDKISVRTNKLTEVSFEKYDSLVHVAGIAHSSTDPSQKDKYYKVNTDLTYRVAKKAKEEGVSQFVFLSSIIVYGSGRTKVEMPITKETKPNPTDFYGDSKLQAERKIRTLEDDSFKIAIIRPPMIYGKDSKGNYPRLSKLAKITPIFPLYENKRSMLHIDNLSNFLKIILDQSLSGFFYPQNATYVSTASIVKEIASRKKHRIMFVKIFNPLIAVLKRRSVTFGKLFGDFYYEREISNFELDYNVRSFEESIRLTEEK
jgi:UDP-glucose 4-epimerase